MTKEQTNWEQQAKYIINDFHLGTLVAIETGTDTFEKTEKAKEWAVNKIGELISQEKEKVRNIIHPAQGMTPEEIIRELDKEYC